jgi:NAD(P)-dependent dehydrogenase (short-subunit alcohol dehydrogenase family)
LFDGFSLHGKVALVTGAGRGIGRAIAIGLAQSGADVALLARTRSCLEEVAERVREAGRRSLILPADVKDVHQIRAAFARFDEEFGSLDVFVASAGVSQRVPFLDVTEDDYRDVFDTNVRGMIFGCQEAGRRMVAGGGGAMVLVSSIVADMALMNRNVYGSSKGAVSALARALALEWSQAEIRVNAIAPGFIETAMTQPILDLTEVRKAAIEQTPLRRIGLPEDTVGAAIFLASPAAAFITGETIVIDGGVIIS